MQLQLSSYICHPQSPTLLKVKKAALNEEELVLSPPLQVTGKLRDKEVKHISNSKQGKPTNQPSI